jgi:DNA-directed RNA polymerase specialized sigma subunit
MAAAMSKREYEFAEVAVDQAVLEQFSQEMSAYSSGDSEPEISSRRYSTYKRKLLWHIHHTLSQRQRQTLLLILSGKTERDVAAVLGVTQQVVHIYKWRAIKRLHECLVS